MKTHLRFASCLLLCGLAFPHRAPAGALVPPQIIQTVEPRYPLDMERIGITSGKVELVVKVDSAGKLEDVLVTAYTKRRFADEATRAVRQWTFEPASDEGTPVGWVRAIEINFIDEGAMVVLNGSEYAGMHSRSFVNGYDEEAFEYHACSLRDLDAIPVPRHVVPPAGSLQAGSAPVEVDFYIDEEGHVRAPVAKGSANAAFANAAVDAVSQWQFEPPTSNGKPVLVRAIQTFTVKPASPPKE